MHLRHLALSNFRNYAALDLEPATGLNVYVGANAQGKSNLLESIAMLGTGKSFRTAHDADTVRAGLDLAVVRGDAKVRSGSVEVVCAIERTARGTRKTYTLNGAAVRYAGYLGNIRVVTFVPADLQLAAGTPAGRRAFLNVALAQSEPRYYHELARYRRAVTQKNALAARYRRARFGASEDLRAHAGRSGDQRHAGARPSRASTRASGPHRARTFCGNESLEVTYEPSVAFDANRRMTP